MRKNNKIIIAIMLVFMVFMSSCKEKSAESDTKENNSGDSTDNTEEYDDSDNQEDIISSVTRKYFENVDKDYRDDDIIEEIGAPSHIEGSGIIYLVWDLTDGTEAYVCFSPRDNKIERIHIIAADGSDELLYKRQHNN